MARVDIESFAGEQFTQFGTITKGGGPFPGSPAGYDLRFTAYRTRAAAPLVTKNVASGVTLDIGGAWTVSFVAADTKDFTHAELLSYYLTLVEPSNADVTVVEFGTWKVKRGA